MEINNRSKEEAQNQTKKSFDWLFQQHRDYYEKQTKQDEKLTELIKELHIEENLK